MGSQSRCSSPVLRCHVGVLRLGVLPLLFSQKNMASDVARILCPMGSPRGRSGRTPLDLWNMPRCCVIILCKVLGYGRRYPVQGAEEEREQISKLSGKRTAVTKIPGEASILKHRRGKPANGLRAISQVKRQGRPSVNRSSLLLWGRVRGFCIGR